MSPALLLGVDIGTTHCKAGIFALDGAALALASRPTVTRRDEAGRFFYDPETLWETVVAAVREATLACEGRQVVAVGVAGMAEAGLLVDRRGGAPRSHLIPWFDPRSQPQAALIEREVDVLERFRLTGLRPSFKYSLAKLLWLRDQDPAALDGAVWLSAPDYVAYRMGGAMATDHSLATRTYAFRIDRREWDGDLLAGFGLRPELFPPAALAGAPAGTLDPALAEALGLSAGVSVAVAGHDHLCAAVAAGAVEPGLVLDSMGTAEILVGALEERPLGRAEFELGLSYGCHVVPGRYVWIGGISASGGSLEWLRSIVADAPPSYEQLLDLLALAPEAPTKIFYYPYLSGSGAPRPDTRVRAAFAGLGAGHGRAELLRAVLEGTAYEMESIRRAAEQAGGVPIGRILAVGGGTRNRPWLQIKADVSGCRLDLPSLPEATLLGAALVAGAGCGVYAGIHEASAAVARSDAPPILPDPARHAAYRRCYEQGYLPLQQPLRDHARLLERLSDES